MPQESDFNTIHLNTFLTDKEIKNLSQYKTFTDIKDSKYAYEKDELLLKFISLAIEKFEEIKDNSLVKCFKWVKNEFQIHLGLKPKVSPLIDLQKTNEEKDKQKLNWYKEYSSLNNADSSFYENLSKNILKYAFKKYITFLRIKRENKNLKEKNNDYKIDDIFKSDSLKKLNKLKEYFIDSDEFNIFTYEKKIGPANLLRTISIFAIKETKLNYLINEKKLINFTNEITIGYNRENPYHTDIHAADMVQTIFLYNKRAKFKSHINCDDLDLLSLFISAIIHDYGHPGLSNNFLINTKNELAIMYNDKSVLENFHVSQAFKIMNNNFECNVLDNFNGSDYQMLRKNIITCVLGTDMSLHKKMIQKFNLRIKSFEINKGKNIENIFKDLDNAGNYKLKLEFLALIIHTADISNPTKPLDVYNEWANRVANEFFLQGDLEKKNNMDVSFNCDRNSTTVAKIQFGFIDFIVEPLFNMIVEYFPQLDFTVKNIIKNKKYYKDIVDKEKNVEKNKENNEKIENKKCIKNKENEEKKEDDEKIIAIKETIESEKEIKKKGSLKKKYKKEKIEKKESEEKIININKELNIIYKNSPKKNGPKSKKKKPKSLKGLLNKVEGVKKLQIDLEDKYCKYCKSSVDFNKGLVYSDKVAKTEDKDKMLDYFDEEGNLKSFGNNNNDDDLATNPKKKNFFSKNQLYKKYLKK